MSSRINLNDSVADRFEFTVGGLDYDLVYPSLEELEPAQELINKHRVLEKQDTPESVQELTEIESQMNDAIYALIKPVGHDTPIKDTLRKQPYPVVQAFNKTITEQLSAE